LIAHVVLFTPHASWSEEQRRQVVDAITQAVTLCPSVRECRVGRRVRHGLPGYEQAMRENYEYALVLGFDDVEGLREYLAHPAHGPIGSLFSAGGAASLAYDYEMATIGEALRLL
jgi:hypothetical protein